MDRKVIRNLYLSKVSCLGCIPVAFLKNCEPELSYIWVELFNMCLKESCFPGCCKISSVIPVFKNVWEKSTTKTCHPVNLLFVVDKTFEKLVDNMLVDHLEKRDLFRFPVWFYIFFINCISLTVGSDRIAGGFNRSGATRAVTLDISKAFNRV